MQSPPWLSIETQLELDRLERSIPWEDARTIEFYGTNRIEPFFPGDVSRCGQIHKNIYVLVRYYTSKGPRFLELVLIHCDHGSLWFLEKPDVRGHVDSLKRVEFRGFDGVAVARCARVMYRFIDEVGIGPYYGRANGD